MREYASQWNTATRLGVTFLGLFLCLNAVPLLVLELPLVSEPLAMAWISLWGALMPILGNATFGIEGPISTMPNGSSDMTWNYVQEFWYLVIAAVVAVVWVARVRRQSSYDAMHAWMRSILRYWLALHMFGYGLIKVFGQQMGQLEPLTLEQNFGDLTPGALLWSFMAYSPAYKAFTGLAEVLGGALLLSRRTTTLGALVTIGVMANVVMMNFCYDIPVKIYSTLFLLTAMFLVGPDARRVADVFVRNRPTAAADWSRPVLGPRLRIARLVAKGGFLLIIAWQVVEQWQRLAARQARSHDRPALYGVWDVESFAIEGQPRPASAGDALRWRQLGVTGDPMAVVRRTGQPSLQYALAHDEAAGTLTLTPLAEPAQPIVLAVARPASDELTLTGPLGPGQAEIRLRRRDSEHARLVTRGFRWITEEPGL
jgi:hypothetical protein